LSWCVADGCDGRLRAAALSALYNVENSSVANKRSLMRWSSLLATTIIPSPKMCLRTVLIYFTAIPLLSIPPPPTSPPSTPSLNPRKERLPHLQRRYAPPVRRLVHHRHPHRPLVRWRYLQKAIQPRRRRPEGRRPKGRQVHEPPPVAVGGGGADHELHGGAVHGRAGRTEVLAMRAPEGVCQ
jgi:hypothetical protein